jgi:hypothetical protein
MNEQNHTLSINELTFTEVHLGEGPLQFFINDQFSNPEKRLADPLSAMRPRPMCWDRSKGVSDTGCVTRFVAPEE